MKQINLNLLETVDRAHVYLAIPDEVKDSLKGYPEILDRVLNSLEFLCRIDGDYHDRFRCALIRAALTELVSIEDVQDTLVNKGNWAKKCMINDSGNPLLCVVRELRHYGIHISSMAVDMEKKDFMWGDFQKPSQATPVFGKNIYYVNNIFLCEFKKLKNYKTYDGKQLECALDWFNQTQKEWGITEMLYRAILLFSCELASTLPSSRV